MKIERVELSKINEDIYKLDMMPVTSVFFVRKEKDYYIVDAGQSEEDVKQYLLPAISKLQISLSQVKGILVTHNHWDHIDGIPELLQNCPNAKVFLFCPETNPYYDGVRFVKVSDNQMIGAFMKVITLPGHAPDCVAFLDLRTNTLFPGDAIQLYGISDCGMLMNDSVDRYVASMKRLLELEIDNILASHPYVPCGAFAFGTESSRKHIETSLSCIYDLITFTQTERTNENDDVEKIKKKYVEERKKLYADFPTDGFNQAIKSVISLSNKWHI